MTRDEPEPTGGHALGDADAIAAEIAAHRRSWIADVRELRTLRAEVVALRRFRAAIDAASLAYQKSWESRDLLTLERTVRLALKHVQDELDAPDGAREADR